MPRRGSDSSAVWAHVPKHVMPNDATIGLEDDEQGPAPVRPLAVASSEGSLARSNVLPRCVFPRGGRALAGRDQVAQHDAGDPRLGVRRRRGRRRAVLPPSPDIEALPSPAGVPSGRSWLYSSNVGQYFARTGEDTKQNVDVRESFSWSPIVLLGRRYVLDRTPGGAARTAGRVA